MPYTINNITPTVEARFWAKVNRTDTCWLWTGCLNKPGYGMFSIDRVPRMAHRIAWVIHYKQDWPVELQSRHMCNNPSCVNPAHIVPGTQLENAADRIKTGRLVRALADKYDRLEGAYNSIPVMTPLGVARSISDARRITGKGRKYIEYRAERKLGGYYYL